MHIMISSVLYFTSHILSAAMEVFGMDSLEDEPCNGLIQTDINKLSKQEEVLQYLVGLIIDSYVDINHCLSEMKTRAILQMMLVMK